MRQIAGIEPQHACGAVLLEQAHALEERLIVVVGRRSIGHRVRAVARLQVRHNAARHARNVPVVLRRRPFRDLALAVVLCGEEHKRRTCNECVKRFWVK